MSAASAPLSLPLYRANPAQAVARFVRKFATFTGRASQSEFWWVALALFLVHLVPNILLAAGLVSGLNNSIANQVPVTVGTDPDGGMLVGSTGPTILDDPTAASLIPTALILSAILTALLIVPTLALVWRRLHDANLAGAWFFLGLIPGIGWLFLLALVAQPAKSEGHRFDAG
jgi:uncharacterized membrane protein YhaH (DUF805 family)